MLSVIKSMPVWEGDDGRAKWCMESVGVTRVL